MDQSRDRRVVRTWRMRLGIAMAVGVIFAALTVLGLVRANWVFAAALGAFTLLAAARLWLMIASHQPVSWVGTAVILLSGPRRFIAESGMSGRDEP